MELSEHSKAHLKNSFIHWRVPEEYIWPLYNYLVYGFEPGSFFTAILCNDFYRAMTSSHPSNQIDALKNVVKWMINAMPVDSFGSKDKVSKWMQMTEADRRKILVDSGLIFAAEKETWLILKDVPVENGAWA